MTNLSTETKNHVIIFNDSSKIFITKVQAHNIFHGSMGSNPNFELDGNMYKFSAVKKILNLKEFYNQYPDQRPKEYPTEPEVPREKYTSVTKTFEKNKHILELMLKGLLKYIKERGGWDKVSPATISLAKDMKNKLNKLT